MCGWLPNPTREQRVRKRNEANSMKCAQIFMQFALSECLNGAALKITERNKWQWWRLLPSAFHFYVSSCIALSLSFLHSRPVAKWCAQFNHSASCWQLTLSCVLAGGRASARMLTMMVMTTLPPFCAVLQFHICAHVCVCACMCVRTNIIEWCACQCIRVDWFFCSTDINKYRCICAYICTYNLGDFQVL